jgi:hypothetical protein
MHVPREYGSRERAVWQTVPLKVTGFGDLLSFLSGQTQVSAQRVPWSSAAPQGCDVWIIQVLP